jgi:hypothetical protein
MSARIPHLLTRLLSSDDLDALKAEFLRHAELTTGPATLAWMDAAILLEKTRNDSYQRRAKATPSARRKSLSRR